MNSTVLEEGAAMGRAILVLQSDDYLSFATPIVAHFPVAKLTPQSIEECIAEYGRQMEDLIFQGREALGLDLPVSRLTI